MATQVTGARIFYKDEAEALPPTGNIVGDVYVSLSGSKVIREETFDTSGWINRGVVDSAASIIMAGGDLVSLDPALPLGSQVTITQALTKIAEFRALGGAVGLQFDVATNDLNQFVIMGKFGSGGTYQSLFSTAIDFTVPEGLLFASSGDLTIVAASGTGTFILQTKGLYSVRLDCASSNVAGSGVTVNGSAI